MNAFSVWCPDRNEGREDAVIVQAVDHEDAAEVWAQRSDADSGEYLIANGYGVTVMVQSEDDDKPQAFTVEGESVPSYTAYAKDDAS